MLKKLLVWIPCSLLQAANLLFLAAQAQQKPQDEKAKASAGTPVLWREPSDIASRNLYFGPGGEAMRLVQMD